MIDTIFSNNSRDYGLVKLLLHLNINFLPKYSTQCSSTYTIEIVTKFYQKLICIKNDHADSISIKNSIQIFTMVLSDSVA